LENLGDFTETFNVTLCASLSGCSLPPSAIYSFAGVTLTPGSTVTLTISGLSFSVGFYTLNVRVYNANLDNTFAGVTVQVTTNELFRPWICQDGSIPV
jgi:hypothetical protein